MFFLYPLSIKYVLRIEYNELNSRKPKLEIVVSVGVSICLDRFGRGVVANVVVAAHAHQGNVLVQLKRDKKSITI